MRNYIISPKFVLISLLLALVSVQAGAHHSMQLYDKERLVTIEGKITGAKFGFPHSRYYIEVTDESGESAEWLMTAQDPKDARRFGYFKELEALKVGDRLAVVGWLHKNNDREILGQEMVHEDNGRVELIPISGYVRSQLYRSMDQAVLDPRVLKMVTPDNQSMTDTQKVYQWSKNDHPVARAAAEVQLGRAKLIGFSAEGFIDFAGMPSHLACQTEEGHSMVIYDEELRDISDQDMRALINFIQLHNRVLAKHWELTRTSCGQ